MSQNTTYIVEGKYTSGKGGYGWEQLAVITPEEGGQEEAERLCAEHQLGAPYGQHRYRPARPSDDI